MLLIETSENQSFSDAFGEYEGKDTELTSLRANKETN